MKKYSIRDIEQLTGIKAHTLRIWEQRYNLLMPHRTDSNIRYYDEEQLKLLLNVALLTQNGHRISQVSKFSKEEFKKKVKEIYEGAESTDPGHAVQTNINGLILAMLELDEFRFEKIFNTHLIKWGLEKTIINLVYPFTQRMGIMWRIGEVTNAQEHFMYNLIRQKIIVAIDAIPIADQDAEKFILFLPESEFDDLFILLATYLLKAGGKRIIYLGQDIPVEDLVSVCDMTKPQALMTFLTAPSSKESMQRYVNELGRHFDLPVYISGNVDYLDNLKLSEDMQVLNNLEEISRIAKR